MRICNRCPDRVLCDVLDDPDIQFSPAPACLEEIRRRLGWDVGPAEVARVEECLLRGRWVPFEYAGI